MDLYFHRIGAGHTLIILHGLFGSSDNWRTLSKTFGKFYNVFAVDLRNHGRSPHDDIMSYPVMAEDLRKLMQRQNLASVYMIGHSMGGKVAMQFAVTYPEMVDKLVVVDIALRAYPPVHYEIFDALLSLDLEEFSSRRKIDKFLEHKIPDNTVRQFLLKNVKRNDIGIFTWKMNLNAIYNNYNEIIKETKPNQMFDKPTLFIKGEYSPYIRQEDIEQNKHIFPRSQLMTVQGAAHWVHSEAPKEFTEIVLEFIGI